MRYVERVNLNIPNLTFDAYQFRANSIFDPNYTGIGHQPMGHDRFNTLYRTYEVLGSRIRAQVCKDQFENGVGTDQVIIGLECDDTTGFDASVTEQLENQRTYYKILSNGRSGRTPISISKGFSYRKMVCGDMSKRSDNKSAFGTNPTQSFYFHFLYSALHPTGTPGTMSVMFTIDYIVLLSDVNDAPED